MAARKPSLQVQEDTSKVIHQANENSSTINPEPNSHSPTSLHRDELNTSAPAYGSKPCSICSKPRNVLIRCQTDATGTWKFVCTGRCWQSVSGGQMGGDTAHPHYKYGGTWKNKHEYVSAKIKGKAKEENKLGYQQGRPYRKTARRLGAAGQKDGRELSGKDEADLAEEWRVDGVDFTDEESGGEEDEEREWEGVGEALGGG